MTPYLQSSTNWVSQRSPFVIWISEKQMPNSRSPSRVAWSPEEHHWSTSRLPRTHLPPTLHGLQPSTNLISTYTSSIWSSFHLFIMLACDRMSKDLVRSRYARQHVHGPLLMLLSKKLTRFIKQDVPLIKLNCWGSSLFKIFDIIINQVSYDTFIGFAGETSQANGSVVSNDSGGSIL